MLSVTYMSTRAYKQCLNFCCHYPTCDLGFRLTLNLCAVAPCDVIRSVWLTVINTFFCNEVCGLIVYVVQDLYEAQGLKAVSKLVLSSSHMRSGFRLTWNLCAVAHVM